MGFVRELCGRVILGIKNIKTVFDILMLRLKNHKFGKNDPCFCGNNKKVNDCHLHRYNDLKFIDDGIITR